MESLRLQMELGRTVLKGKRILIVEDEPLIAFDLEAAIKAQDGAVVGPAHSLADAMQLAENEDLQGAILDVRLQDCLATSVLECLKRRGIPCVVHTGQADPALLDTWSYYPMINKPALPEVVLAALDDEMSRSAPR